MSPSPLQAVTPALSFQPLNFSAEAPGPEGWRPLLDQCRAADLAGIDRLVVSDHVAFGEDLEAYGRPEIGGITGGVQPTGPDGHWLEPLTLLSVVAGLTSHSRLMTGILIAALRRPVVLAKSLATLDVLSGGRVDLGVGVGWQREEYEAAGLPFEGRGRLLDRSLELCRLFWSQRVASYESEGLRFDKVHMSPKPLQPGGVPLWISGTLNRNVLRRIGRFGAGWIPWGADAADPVAGLARVRGALAEAGRSADGFQVTAPLGLRRGEDVGAAMDRAAALAEQGITDFRLGVRVSSELSAATDELAPIVASFRTAVGR